MLFLPLKPNGDKAKDGVDDEVQYIMSSWNMNYGGVPIHQSSPFLIPSSTGLPQMKPGSVVPKAQHDASTTRVIAVVLEKHVFICHVTNKTPSLASALGSISMLNTLESKKDGSESPALSVVVNLGGSVLDARQPVVDGERGTNPTSHLIGWWPAVETANQSEKSLIEALTSKKGKANNHAQTRDGLGLKKLFDDYMAERTQSGHHGSSLGIGNTSDAVSNNKLPSHLIVSPHFARTAASTFLLNLKGDELDTLGEFESNDTEDGERRLANPRTFSLPSLCC